MSSVETTGITLGRGGILDVDRPADDHHFVPALERRLGQGLAHATARGVGQIAHRVEVLPRRTGGDEDAGHGLTCHASSGSWRQRWAIHTGSRADRRLGNSSNADGGEDLFRRGHAAHAAAAATEPAFLGIDEVDAVAAQLLRRCAARPASPTSRSSWPGPSAPGRRTPAAACSADRRPGRRRPWPGRWPWPGRRTAARLARPARCGPADDVRVEDVRRAPAGR